MPNPEDQDIRLLEEVEATLQSISSAQAFTAASMALVRRLVPCDCITVNEINTGKQKMRTSIDPPEIEKRMPDWQDVFARHMHEHPVANHHRDNGDLKAYKISDFLDSEAFHRLNLYTDFFGKIGVEYQIAFGFACEDGTTVIYSLNRRYRDFSERERRRLNLIRPQLMLTYAMLEHCSMMERELDSLLRADELSGWDIALICSDGKLMRSTRKARQLLDTWHHEQQMEKPNTYLTADWVQHLFGELSEHPDPQWQSVSKRVKIDGEHHCLRLMGTGIKHCPWMIVIGKPSSSRGCPCADVLESFGLSSKQAKVLEWLAQGKTDEEIAGILDLSVRTVQKHLQHIYQQIGVDSRTTAVLRAMHICS